MRTNYEGVIFNTIWNMMQPAPENRCGWDAILNDPELGEAVKKIEQKHPGLIQKTLTKERLNLKKMVPLDQDMNGIGQSMQETYGRFISEDGVLSDHLAPYNSK